MAASVALALGLLLASGPRCERRAESPAPPPAAVFAALGGPALDGLVPCTAGSVPARLAWTRLDDLPPRPGAVAGQRGCQSHGCWAWAGWNDRREMQGAGARLTIGVPATVAPDHSLAEVALQWGTDDRDIVEVGWEVAPRRYGDALPHLFVHRWIDGRACEGDCSFLRWSPRLVSGMSLAAWPEKPVAMGLLLWKGLAWASPICKCSTCCNYTVRPPQESSGSGRASAAAASPSCSIVLKRPVTSSANGIRPTGAAYLLL